MTTPINNPQPCPAQRACTAEQCPLQRNAEIQAEVLRIDGKYDAARDWEKIAERAALACNAEVPDVIDTKRFRFFGRTITKTVCATTYREVRPEFYTSIE